ncbi:MAG: hypothetical protein BRD50_01155 [Bacteroidetes bacterium SW_11_45_7]|nr:MAG: hypothetical protein BRD50_01155 [Bacteroidetes bacterium SW_11_45_7]
MRFIIDAQLPPSWVEILRADGYDAVHTSQLKEGNTTSDETILEVAESEDRIVVTKDSDFYYTFVTNGRPQYLVFVKLGNIRIQAANQYLKVNLSSLIKALYEGALIELWPNQIKVVY